MMFFEAAVDLGLDFLALFLNTSTGSSIGEHVPDDGVWVEPDVEGWQGLGERDGIRDVEGPGDDEVVGRGGVLNMETLKDGNSADGSIEDRLELDSPGWTMDVSEVKSEEDSLKYRSLRRFLGEVWKFKWKPNFQTMWGRKLWNYIGKNLALTLDRFGKIWDQNGHNLEL